MSLIEAQHIRASSIGRTGSFQCCFRAAWSTQPDRTHVVKVVFPPSVRVTFADVADAPENNGQAALHFAAFAGNRKIVNSLLKARANINAKDNLKKTAVMYAAMRGHDEVIGDLIRAGADLAAKDQNGYTAIRYSTESGHTEATQLLKQAVEKE